MRSVADAIAQRNLRRAVVDQKLAVLLMQDGEPCGDMLVGLAGTMQLVLEACYTEHLNTPDTNVLKGSLNACLQVIMADAYDTTQTTAILLGLDKAELLAAKLKPNSITRAWGRMSRAV